MPGRDPTAVAAEVHGLDTVPLSPRLLDAIRSCLETAQGAQSAAKQAAKARKTLQKLIAATERLAPRKGEAWWPRPVMQHIAALERERDAKILAMQQRIARERAEAAKGTLPYGTRMASGTGYPGAHTGYPGGQKSWGRGSARKSRAAVATTGNGRADQTGRRGGKTGRFVTGLVVIGVIVGVALALSGPKKSPTPPPSSAPPYRFAHVGGVTLSQTVSGESVPIAPGTALKACTPVSVTVHLKNTGADTWANSGHDTVSVDAQDAGGCWVVTGSGTVVPYGDAPAEAPESGYHAPTAGVVGIAAVPGGFLLAVSHVLAQQPEVVPYGTAAYEDISVQLPLNQPIVAIAAASDGSGYWLLGADGGVFNSSGVSDRNDVLDNASSAVNDPRNVDNALDFVGIAASPDNRGYTIVDAQGLVLTYGDAAPLGPVTDSLPADASVVGMAPGARTPTFADSDALVR